MIVNRFATPGFAEAVKAENDIRDAAFLDLTANICGVEIRQMTPRDLIILEGIGNPVAQKVRFSKEDVFDFLRVMSVHYRPGAWFNAWRIKRAVNHMDAKDAIPALIKYLDATFQDSPSGGGAGIPYAGWCAYYADIFGSEYGWPMERTLSTKLKVLYQLLKCIRRRHDPECILMNPSDKIKGDALRLKQARLGLVNLLSRRARN